MAEDLMLLPSADPSRIRLLRVPRDLGTAEAYRLVTGLIAALESERAPEDGNLPVEEVIDVLEGRGFEVQEFVQGPTLD